MIVTRRCRSELGRLAVSVTAPIRFYANNADIRLRAQPLVRAVATSAINHNDFVRPRADKFAHLFNQQAHKEKSVVTDGNEADRVRHFCFIYREAAIG